MDKMVKKLQKLETGGHLPTERNSNLELLRIIAMFLIVSHHYVVNSGITELYDFDNITANMVFLQFWGLWGKTAINVFVFITGYFMCVGRLTWQRFLKLFLEVIFYRYLVFVCFAVAGYEEVTAETLFKLVFNDLWSLNAGFLSAFLAFYLFIPFYNALIEKLSRGQLLKLILMLVGLFTVCLTFFFNSIIFHHVGWYMALYFIAAYIRIYEPVWSGSRRFCGWLLFGTIMLSYLSVIVVDFVGSRLGFDNAYHMVSDSNKLFALIIGVTAVCFFKNLKPRYNKFINSVAATTFGVLLIHANSDAMRRFLWKDFLQVPSMYEASLIVLIGHAVLCAVCVFILCSFLDYLRIRFIERPVFRWIDRREDRIESFWLRSLERIDRGVQRVLP